MQQQRQAAPASMDNTSYLSPLGYQYSSCGYCKSNPKATSACYWARSARGVQPEHYQLLVDRGWRRSGTQYYKPDVRHSCCPHYTIRLDAAAFKPSKDQRQVVNRLSKYVLGQEYLCKAASLCPKSRQEKKWRRNHFDLGQVLVEFEDHTVKQPIDPATKVPIEPAHKFQVILEPDKFTEEKYALFAHYQKTVHKEPQSRVSRSGFKSFLCSGLGQRSIERDGRQLRIGSYHQCYRLDGRLVAMGVLDLMPHGVSSVYLIYHSSVSDFNFGKVSALQEVTLALSGGYRCYYMGYYIHSCIKMRYKATFHPTSILDPETLTFSPITPHLLSLLSQRSYISLSRELRLRPSLPASPSPLDYLQANQPCASNFEIELSSGRENFLDDLDYVIQEDRVAKGKEAATEGSLFDIGMPGVMSREEVTEILPEIENWRIRSGAMVVKLGDLSDFATTQITDAYSLKGIAAELAACIGVEVVRGSVIVLGR